jgi:uncharacterized protein YjbI with pentapeptide repeats
VRTTNLLIMRGNVAPHSLSNYVYIAIKRLPPNERPHQDPIIITEGSANIVLASHPELKPKKIEDTLASMLKLLREGNVQEFNKMREENSATLPNPVFFMENLHGAHIAGANLSKANLNKVDLSEADLEGANLSHAYLIGAYLDGANLSNTNCTNAVFEAANLSNANLTKANLYHAKISSEDLQQASTDGAIYEPPDKQRRPSILNRKTKIAITVGIATVISAVLALALFNQQMLTNEKYALYEKGNALDKTGNYTGAIMYFDKALKIDPNFKDALYDKGNALDYIHKAALINEQKLTNEKYVYYEKGHALLNNLGNYTGAIKYLDKALAIDPNYKDALNDKGKA